MTTKLEFCTETIKINRKTSAKMCNTIAICPSVGTISGGQPKFLFKKILNFLQYFFICFIFFQFSFFTKTRGRGRCLVYSRTYCCIFPICLWIPWRWRQKPPATRREIFTRLHGVISQNTWILNVMKIRGTVICDMTPCSLAYFYSIFVSEKQ